PDLASQPPVVERFRSEAVTLAKLNHPNIATLYSFFRQGEEFFMVLEFVRGNTLDQMIAERGAMPSEVAVPLFCQVLDGIDHAHRFGIIHRDIKPANMMLMDTGALKVLDFGIARILGSARMTKAGHLIGTIEYMAPEQVRGQETDARSDIYSLGMLLYEMLTGRVPFDIQNEFELMKAQIEQMPIPPRQINPTIPPGVEQAIGRAIAKNPDERFQTAGEFRNVLLGAGFASTGALDSTVQGAALVNPYATRPISNPQITAPPASIPPVSRDIPAETRLGAMPAAAVGAPVQPAANFKETRLGAAGATAANVAAKETRLGGVGTQPGQMQPAYAPGPQGAQAQGSFFSSLTWVHYAGAGVAALFVVGVLIAVPLLLLAGGDKKPSTPPVATKPAAPPATETPAPPAQEATTTGNSTGAAELPKSQQPVITEIKPIEEPEPAAPSTGNAKPSKPSQRAAAPPQRERPRNSGSQGSSNRRSDLKKALTGAP
ncbi:MAG: serine/threonine protein kinase, partial [Pyrinomonadaceae bacterium]